MTVIPFRSSFDNITRFDPEMKKRLDASLIKEFASHLQDGRAEALDLTDTPDCVTWLQQRVGHKYSTPTIERLAEEAALLAQQHHATLEMVRF